MTSCNTSGSSNGLGAPDGVERFFPTTVEVEMELHFWKDPYASIERCQRRAIMRRSERDRSRYCTGIGCTGVSQKAITGTDRTPQPDIADALLTLGLGVSCQRVLYTVE